MHSLPSLRDGDSLPHATKYFNRNHRLSLQLNIASIHRLVILFLVLPQGVGDLHGKADENSCSFLVDEDDALGLLGGWRRHRNGRWAKSGRERGCIMWVVLIILANKHTSCLWESNSAKWTLNSVHCCSKLRSNMSVREEDRRRWGTWWYHQQGQRTKIGRETTFSRRSIYKLVHVCTIGG